MRGRPLLIVMMLVMLAVVSGGCAHKQALATPTTMAESPPPQASARPAPPVPPAPTPPVVDPLAGDLDAVNRYVVQKGLLADVLFDYDRDDLRDDARRQLQANARFLKEHPQLQIALEGHADERGTIEYNLALGQRRAVMTRSYLDTMGVSAERLRATTYGEERPLCSDENEGCWQRNRRVHFEIVSRIE